ncbi:hypothetical protein D3C76_1259960 [compost metagenome]
MRFGPNLLDDVQKLPRPVVSGVMIVIQRIPRNPQIIRVTAANHINQGSPAGDPVQRSSHSRCQHRSDQSGPHGYQRLQRRRLRCKRRADDPGVDATVARRDQRKFKSRLFRGLRHLDHILQR